MRSSLSLSVGFASLLSIANAHTKMWYPEWRGNSFIPPFSQLISPCAGFVDNATTPRTLWPLDGGSVNVSLHDESAYIFINIGLGANTTNFNMTIFSLPLNSTGAGDLCFPKLPLPPGLVVEDGTEASIQFVTTNHRGGSLYSCADITFSKDATVLPADQCKNSSTITITPFGYGDSTSDAPPSTTSDEPAATSSSAASALARAGFAPSIFVLALAGFFTAML